METGLGTEQSPGPLESECAMLLNRRMTGSTCLLHQPALNQPYEGFKGARNSAGLAWPKSVYHRLISCLSQEMPLRCLAADLPQGCPHLSSQMLSSEAAQMPGRLLTPQPANQPNIWLTEGTAHPRCSSFCTNMLLIFN